MLKGCPDSCLSFINADSGNDGLRSSLVDQCEYATKNESIEWKFKFMIENKWHESTARDILLLGAYTDDTQFTRELALSMVQARGFDAEAFAHRLALLQKHNAIERGGSTSRSALKQLLVGQHWRTAGLHRKHICSNGAAMRAGNLQPLLLGYV